MNIKVDASIKSKTKFSSCRKWRYALKRKWGIGGICMFVGLNPSTADETYNDPTVNRCMRFAQGWGYGSMYMTNIFAFRATDPNDMKSVVYPIGPDNNKWLIKCAEKASIVIACWGVHGEHLGRQVRVRKLLKPYKLHCLGLTKEGYPKHPLYLRKDLKPIRWK